MQPCLTGRRPFSWAPPVFREETCLGYLVFRLPLQQISQRMGEREGMGQTGETYLVGPDRRMRSDAFNDPINHSVKVSLAGTVGANGVDTRAVTAALAGKTGSGIIVDYQGKTVLSSYGPMELKDLKWVMLAEIDAGEALGPTRAVRRLTAGVATMVAVLALILSLQASGRIVRPVRRLTDWSRRIAAGNRDLVDIGAPKNEIGLLNDSFRDAVISLQKADALQAQHNWLKTGQSELDERMRGEQNLERLCAKVVTFFAGYLGAQVGAFYIHDGKGVFRLKANYAYKTRKNLSNAFGFGEGLVGQAALEKQSILLTRVPEDYIRVVSALGEKQPRNILVVPFVFNDAAIGVMEIGSFADFTDDQRALLEASADGIAIALHSASARERLQDALATTQRQAEELQAQQEELKTANEELEEQAGILRESEERLRTQQEELQVTNEELEEKTDLLERQKRDIEQANEELERSGAELEEKAEDLALASKYKSEFLANMSHELRTPLNSLLLLADTLAENSTGNLTGDQTQSAVIIRDSGQQLLSLINEILDLAKIEAGRMELHLETISIRDLGSRAENHFRHMAQAKGLEMRVEIDPAAPVEMITDGGRVDQIIRNLVSNAIKFTDAGTVTVAFMRPRGGVMLKKSGLDPSTALAVSVTDTGIGIPSDMQKVIFEAFQQADTGTARRYSGTGLGLSISKELANLLGGEIQLESTEGKGSTFTLFLPEACSNTEGGNTADRCCDGKKDVFPRRGRTLKGGGAGCFRPIGRDRCR